MGVRSAAERVSAEVINVTTNSGDGLTGKLGLWTKVSATAVIAGLLYIFVNFFTEQYDKAQKAATELTAKEQERAEERLDKSDRRIERTWSVIGEQTKATQALAAETKQGVALMQESVYIMKEHHADFKEMLREQKTASAEHLKTAKSLQKSVEKLNDTVEKIKTAKQ